MFKLYKAKDRTAYFWIEHWDALLEDTRLTELAGWCKQDRALSFLVLQDIL